VDEMANSLIGLSRTLAKAKLYSIFYPPAKAGGNLSNNLNANVVSLQTEG